jgi:hypothetical protein
MTNLRSASEDSRTVENVNRRIRTEGYLWVASLCNTATNLEGKVRKDIPSDPIGACTRRPVARPRVSEPQAAPQAPLLAAAGYHALAPIPGNATSVGAMNKEKKK